MKVGQIIGRETKTKEFKELCFHNIYSYYEKRDIVNLIYQNQSLNKDIFNNMINSELKQYFIKYVPKYLGNFSRAELNGELYFGIDDDGIIEGIPYYGTINIDDIKMMLNESIKYCRGVIIDKNESHLIDNSILELYYSNIELEIIQLDKELNIDEFAYNLLNLQEIKQNNKNVLKAWATYNREYNKWHSNLTYYAGKLLNYLLDKKLKNMVIKYILSEFNNNSSLDKTKLREIIIFFSKNKEEYINISFDVNQIEEILKNKYNPLRWVLDFKDKILDELKKQKPKKPDTNHIKTKDIYGRYCGTLSNIRQYLMKSSEEIEFYIIKIKMKSISKTYIEYKDEKYGRWISRRRIDNNGNPACI